MPWWVHGGISKKNLAAYLQCRYVDSTYDNWNFKPQISSILHFDWASDGGMAHVFNNFEFHRMGFNFYWYLIPKV